MQTAVTVSLLNLIDHVDIGRLGLAVGDPRVVRVGLVEVEVMEPDFACAVAH